MGEFVYLFKCLTDVSMHITSLALSYNGDSVGMLIII